MKPLESKWVWKENTGRSCPEGLERVYMKVILKGAIQNPQVDFGRRWYWDLEEYDAGRISHYAIEEAPSWREWNGGKDPVERMVTVQTAHGEFTGKSSDTSWGRQGVRKDRQIIAFWGFSDEGEDLKIEEYNEERREVMRNVNLFAYKSGSKSGKALAGAIGIKRIAHKNSKYKPNKNKTIINWGSSNMPEELLGSKILNMPQKVGEASNKLKAFQAMDLGDVQIPEYTANKGAAQAWIDEGTIVVARQKLQGHSGEGIVLCGLINKGKENEAHVELVDAPLYVKYIPKNSEYRIHVFQGRVFDEQRKARNREIPNERVDWKVRNHGNGFIFQRNDFEMPQQVKDEAVKAVNALGLDFGAVDIIFNGRQNKAYVLEVNTACGLEGTTLDNYSRVFTEHLEG